MDPDTRVPRRHWWRLLWLLALVPLGAALYVAAMVRSTPSIDDIQGVKVEQPTVLMSADGKVLAVFRRTNREWVKLAQVSPNVITALLSTEDHRFFDHPGLDVRRTLAAALHTVRGDLQGGSTITQQLARNMFPDDIGRAPTIERKVKEAITALKIESVYGKEQILEMYLNTVPFLYNAYGIEMAARTYFDKSASELDMLEAATLIGMLKGTRYYNPVLNPERAVQRRNTVLAQLVKDGKLQQAEFESLSRKPLGLDFERQDEDLGPAPHLAQQLRRWLITWADSHGYNIYADGLVVQTTIDSRLQQMALDALARQADKLQAVADKAWARPTRNRQLLQALIRETPQYRGAIDAGMSDGQALSKLQADADFVKAMWREKTHLQAAFLAQDPVTGEVKAWVGSRDFRQDQFDHVQQARRQPGSTFKPFVYGAAFEQGIDPLEMLIDEPVEIRIDANTVWKPGDVHETTGLPTTLRDGLVYSKNSITAQLGQRVGAARIAQVAHAMGVRQSKLDEVPSLALGTSPVTLKEMVSAYCTIADGGKYVDPVLVVRIENRKHEVLEEFHPRAPEQALQVAASQTLLDVMRGVVDVGTGAGIRSRFGLKGDLAGKTGTTQDNTDGWFILMHPRLVGGAWVGFNDARITMGDAWGQGARNALLIVGDFFQQTAKAHLVDTKAKFNAPRLPTEPDPAVLARINEWLASVMPPVPEVQAEPQPATVAAPLPPIAYQASPGFSAGPPERPPLVIVEPRAENRSPPSAESGIRILRAY